MTSPAAAPPVLDQPGPHTPVLLTRKLHPAADVTQASVFADDWWNLSPGVFEGHARMSRLNFTLVPQPFRTAAKHVIWQMINHDEPVPLRDSSSRRTALSTMPLALPRLNAFLIWLDVQGIGSIADVTAAELDHYLADVVTAESSTGTKKALLMAVRRLWAYRSRLPEPVRLPAPPPWNDDRPAELLTGAKPPRENRTPRIATDTIEPLLMWCLRFVNDLAEDITAAYAEHLQLQTRGRASRRRNPTHGRPLPPTTVKPMLTAYLRRLRESGGALPGYVGSSGRLEPHWPHITRILDATEHTLGSSGRLRQLVERSGLPIIEGDRLEAIPTGRIAGRPWRANPIGYTEAPRLAHLLRTACFVVVAYLTGMRTGEVLNLERGCLQHDPTAGLWSITGRHWKGARDHNGNKIPEGAQRPDPWITVQQAARAINVLERLHRHQLLFPRELHPNPTINPRTSKRPGQARESQSVCLDIDALIGWINNYCDTAGLPDKIPADPYGRIAATRFRRTLAWHIVRRPRGLIAGAIQYGHLHVQMTLGYAGTYDSGFPDEHAYEDWLHRLDRLADDHQRLVAGEHVSGPAADTYQHRIRAAHQQFTGRVLTNIRHARDVVANPLLQIYPGRAMTCVFDPAKALCQLHSTDGDVRRTPDQDDCRPNCQNTAYTDRDIDELRTRLTELQNLTADHLAPSPRGQRHRAERDRLTTIIRQHDHRK